MTSFGGKSPIAPKIPFSGLLTAKNKCLKFNQPFEKRRVDERGDMRYQMPLLRRFATKLVHDILPAALASVIGGLLFAHIHVAIPWGHASEPAAGRPAPAAMIQLLRDEHGLMADFLKAEIAKEKAQFAGAEAGRTQTADAAEPVAGAAAPRAAVAMATAKSAPPRARISSAAISSAATPVAVVLPPLVIAQAQLPGQEVNSPAPRGADSLLARTIGLKDHVVAVTHQVVSAIGGIPSWIGSIGDHIGGQDASPRPPADLVSAS